MGNLIAKLFGGSSARPSLDGKKKLGYLAIDNHIRRLGEIEHTLGEIGHTFIAESNRPLSDAGDPLEHVVDSINRLRVPGFIAYNLAQEGLTVINIIAASLAQAKKIGEVSDSFDSVTSHIDDAELKFRQTLDEMDPYKSLDPSATVEAIAAQVANKKSSAQSR